MNMILHGNETHEILQGNTLSDPKFRDGDKLTTFDYLVANPPFSWKSWKNGYENDYGRIEGYAWPPDKNGDYAFLLHMVKSLKTTGKGIVVMPHGVLFRGNTEATIRTKLIKRGLVKAIIGLPANLFYGTGIQACLVVLDKKDAQDRTGIFMVDASKGFEKDGPKNRLRPRDMHKIVDAFVNQKEIERYSRMVPMSEISGSKNDHNLNIPRYIDSSDPDDIQDLYAHIQGGIPDRDLDTLQPYWDAFPSLRADLFKPLRESYSELNVGKTDIQSKVTDSSEYQYFAKNTADTVTDWWADKEKILKDITSSTRPNDLIHDVSEALLEAFRSRPLIDEYGVYEQLMNYWNSAMHDDVALIVGEGWDEAAKPRPARTWKDKNNKTKYEDAHLVFGTGAKAKRWVMDLMPPVYVIARFFAKEKVELDELISRHETSLQAINEYTEEHAVEEGLLWEAVEDDKITATMVKARLKAAKAEKADPEELTALKHALELYATESAAKKAAREATVNLHEQVLLQYSKLTTDDIQTLVVEDKWGGTIRGRIGAEVTALGRALIARLHVLADRYESTVGELDASVEELSAKVAVHLAAMGVRA